MDFNIKICCNGRLKDEILLAIPGIGFKVLQMRIQFICCHLDLFQMLIIVD